MSDVIPSTASEVSPEDPNPLSIRINRRYSDSLSMMKAPSDKVEKDRSSSISTPGGREDATKLWEVIRPLFLGYLWFSNVGLSGEASWKLDRVRQVPQVSAIDVDLLWTSWKMPRRTRWTFWFPRDNWTQGDEYSNDLTNGGTRWRPNPRTIKLLTNGYPIAPERLCILRWLFKYPNVEQNVITILQEQVWAVFICYK